MSKRLSHLRRDWNSSTPSQMQCSSAPSKNSLLQLALGAPLLAVSRAMVAPEVEQTYGARELCQQVGRRPSSVSAPAGIIRLYPVRPEFQTHTGTRGAALHFGRKCPRPRASSWRTGCWGRPYSISARCPRLASVSTRAWPSNTAQQHLLGLFLWPGCAGLLPCLCGHGSVVAGLPRAGP